LYIFLVWAAGYAYGLSRDENYFGKIIYFISVTKPNYLIVFNYNCVFSFTDLSIHLPWVFCNRHVIESAVYSYMPLRGIKHLEYNFIM